MGGAGATGMGIEVMSGIFVEGGYWRVGGWTKMASAEKMSKRSLSLEYECIMQLCSIKTMHKKWGAFFVTNCPRRQDSPI